MTIAEKTKKLATKMVSGSVFLFGGRSLFNIPGFKKELHTEIIIDSSPEIVWEILMNFEEFSNWNPMIRRIKGEAVPGGQLKIFVQPKGTKGMAFEPIATVVEKNREFRWQGKLGFRGLFHGEHIFRIVQTGYYTVLFVHQEKFRGLLVPVLLPMIKKDTLRGFNDMNNSLRLLSERRLKSPYHS